MVNRNSKRPVPRKTTSTSAPADQIVDPQLGVEYGVGPVFPGSLWSDWGGTRGGEADPGGYILNRPAVTIDQIVDMRRRDGQAKALIQLVSLPLRIALQAGEFIEPPEGGATEETKFANLMWNLPPMAGGMTTPKTKLIRQMILSVVDGFAPFEIVRHVPEDGPLKGKLTLEKLAYRDPRTVKIRVDTKGGYSGFKQTTHDGEGQLIDKYIESSKTLLVTHHDEYNPYYGVSMFESAYPHFDAKRKLYYIAHLAAQFAAVPGRVGTVPRGSRPQEVMAFRKSLVDFAFNSAMMKPEGYEVEPFNGSSGFDFLKLIEHHNNQMSKSVLAPFFDSDQRPVLIENGSQDASADIFLLCMESIANDIADVITIHLLPQFIDFNFHSKAYPVFKPGKLSDAAKSLIQEAFKLTTTASVLNVTPEFVREVEKKTATAMGFDIDYVEIEKNEKIQAEENQKMQQEQADLQAQQQAAAAAQPDPNAPPPPVGPQDMKVNAQAALSAGTEGIDDLVLAAERLFLSAPDGDIEQSPVDDV